MDVDTPIQALQARCILDNFYPKSVILEGELSSAKMQAVVGNNYEKIQFALNNFRNILKKKLANNKTCLLNRNDKLL